ncbi:MAG TPA: hypothetical protein VEY11_16400 [Pyrinomonadaceae bacterium]|nr:hypothetical protein [Pyrinomonadaceae bacterium]
MSEADDTKSGANEPGAEARGGDARAASPPHAAFDWTNADPDVPRVSVADSFTNSSADSSADSFTRSPAADSYVAPSAHTSVADASPVNSPSIDTSSASAPSFAVSDDGAVRQPAAHFVEPLVLQTGFQAGGKLQYHVAELLAYHDAHFIEAVYRAILGRAPSHTERARELDELRGGRAGKVEIIERLSGSAEARRGGGAEPRVRIEGLPSPLMRWLGRVPFIGYVLRLVRALVRLPVSQRHQQQFEIYALAQQQLIADYINRTLARVAVAGATPSDTAPSSPAAAQHAEIADALSMFADALLELSNSHAELQAQTQTQAEQAQNALNELTAALTLQQQLSETLRRDQQLAADAQQEFLIQEQRVIVETQRVVLAELRAELDALAARQQRAREEFEAELGRLRSSGEAADAARENASGQA